MAKVYDPLVIADELERALAENQGCNCIKACDEHAIICFDDEWAVIIAALRATKKAAIPPDLQIREFPR